MSEEKSASNPWYKEPWPWFFIALPAVMIVVCIFGLIIPALDTEDTIVSDDYYKEGKNIIMQLKRNEYAAAHNIGAQLYIQPDFAGVMVIMQGDYDTKTPIRLSFMHPTLKKYDQIVTLKQSSPGALQYEAQWPNPLPPTNNWIVRLEDEQNIWRIEARWITSQGNALMLTPQHAVPVQDKNHP